MEDKKKDSLTGQISSPMKYQPNSGINVPVDPLKEFENVKKELDELKKKLLKKFSFTISLSILPADSFKAFEEDEGLLAEEVSKKPMHLMLVIPEDNFKDIPKKIKPEIVKLIYESKQNVWIHIKTPVDLWNYGLDSKFDMLDAIGRSLPLYDKGILGALRVAAIHKTLVLRKFEKYVASYGIAGSLVRGTAGKDSDVDTFVIIDDTDVKRMPRLQLKEKLRGMIYEYIREATALAGVKNVLNVQVWLLTDFWESVKDAHPVMFTFIRDGIPLHDRGTFLPWKLLLKMGKIKPSPEAVDMFMKEGDRTESLINRRLLDAMVDIYLGIITPTQALMMLAGYAPPVPKTMVSEVRDAFVAKEKIMSEKDLKVLEKAIKLWKNYEHGDLKDISGKEIDVFYKEFQDYNKKMKGLREKLEGKLKEHDAEKIDAEVFKLLRNIFGDKGKEELVKSFDRELVKKGKLEPRMLAIVKDIVNIRTKVKGKKFTPSDMQNISRDATDLINALIEYSQRKELVAVEKSVMQVSYGDKKAKIVLTDTYTFLSKDNGIFKIEGKKISESSRDEMEKAILGSKSKTHFRIKSDVFEVLKKELGNFEIEF